MENHPIPQDVTGFQFKLIGNMTVKQFGYLAVGIVLAVIFYYAPIFFLIKYPLIILLAASGICLAFVPIEGRPMDAMMLNFLRALFNPNQFVFHKAGGHLSFDINTTPSPSIMSLPHKEDAKKEKKVSASQKAEELEYYLHHLPRKVQTALDEKERSLLKALPVHPSEKPNLPTSTVVSAAAVPIAAPQLQPIITPPPPPLVEPSPSVVQIPVELQVKTPTVVLPDKKPATAEEIEKAAEKARLALGLPEKKETTASAAPEPKEEEHHTEQAATPPPQPVAQAVPPPATEPRTTELADQLRDVAMQKQQLEDELVTLKKQLSSQAEKPTNSYTAPTPEPQQVEHVRKIPANMARSVGLPNVPDVPNLLTGIIKDSRGNILPHILVEVKDKEGNPVRAFKTNTLGQFASATPLSSGVYTIEFEDPKSQHTFDTIEVTVNNKVILPIEIISHDDREELRKALFN